MKALEYRNAVNAGKIPAPHSPWNVRRELARVMGIRFPSAVAYRAWMNASPIGLIEKANELYPFDTRASAYLPVYEERVGNTIDEVA